MMTFLMPRQPPQRAPGYKGRPADRSDPSRFLTTTNLTCFLFCANMYQSTISTRRGLLEDRRRHQRRSPHARSVARVIDSAMVRVLSFARNALGAAAEPRLYRHRAIGEFIASCRSPQQ